MAASRAEDAEYWRFSKEDGAAPTATTTGGSLFAAESKLYGKKRTREDDDGPTFGDAPRAERTMGTNKMQLPVGGRIPWRHGRLIAEELEAAAAAAAGSGGSPSPSGKPAFFSQPSQAALLRLHEEILDFVAFISPTPHETRIAARALSAVQAVIAKVWPECRVEVFGSRANGLVLPTSDWDLVVFGASPTSTSMRKLAREFEATGVATKTEVIDSARVPIVKAWEAGSGIQIDVSFEVASGLATRACIASLLSAMPPLRPLIIVLKYFLLQRGLNDTYSGGVGSFLLTLMAAHVVQVCAKRLGVPLHVTEEEGGKKAKKVGGKAAPPPLLPLPPAAASGLNLGLLFVSFFEIFGVNHNYTSTGITLRGASGGGSGGYFSKLAKGWYDGGRPFLLCLENPVDTSADVGRNSWAIQRVRRACVYAHTAVARAVRSWEAQSSGLGFRHDWRQGSVRADGFVVMPPPPSILATVIRVDETLLSRADELGTEQAAGAASEHAVEEEGEGAGGGGRGEGGHTHKRAKGAGELKPGQRIPEGGGTERAKGRPPSEPALPPPPSSSSALSSRAAALKGLPAEEEVEEVDAEREDGEEDEEEALLLIDRHGALRARSSGPADGGAVVPPPAVGSVPEGGEAIPGEAQAVTVARRKALDNLTASTAGTGIRLRRPRLLADVLSRKDRGVPRVMPAPEGGWF